MKNEERVVLDVGNDIHKRINNDIGRRHVLKRRRLTLSLSASRWRVSVHSSNHIVKEGKIQNNLIIVSLLIYRISKCLWARC